MAAGGGVDEEEGGGMDGEEGLGDGDWVWGWVEGKMGRGYCDVFVMVW